MPCMCVLDGLHDAATCLAFQVVVAQIGHGEAGANAAVRIPQLLIRSIERGKHRDIVEGLC